MQNNEKNIPLDTEHELAPPPPVIKEDIPNSDKKSNLTPYLILLILALVLLVALKAVNVSNTTIALLIIPALLGISLLIYVKQYVWKN